MNTLIRKKRRVKNEENWKPPFCENFRNFLANSTEQQMLYANFEGCYERRIFDAKDKSFLVQYVYNTLYYTEEENIPSVWNMTELKRIQELYDVNYSLDEEKLKHVEEICKKIVSVGKTKKWEVHLGCIWIYYFDYEDFKEKAIPLFKIYGEEEGDAAAFLDINLTLYKNWHYYLDNAKFSRSFLCVPRNGKYSFVGEQLNLEFFCKPSLQNRHFVKSSSNQNFREKYFKPFSQTAIRSALEKFRRFSTEVQERIIRIATALINRLQNSKISYMSWATFGIACTIKFYDFYKSPGSFIHNIESLALMLFNAQRECSSVEEFIHYTVGSTLDVRSFSSPNYPPFKEQLKVLISLWKEKKRNWFKIFEVVLTIFKKAGAFLFVIEPIILKICQSPVVFVIFNALKVLLNVEFVATNFTSAVNESKPGGSSSLENSLALSHGNEIDEKVFNHPEMLRKFLRKWDLLEKLPVDLVQSLTLEQFKGSVQSNSLKNSECCRTIPITIVDEFAFVYISGLSIPTLNSYCLRFIGPDVQIRVVGDFEDEVVSDTGEVICKLHFISEFIAVGIFKIEKNRKIKLLEELEDV